MYTALLAICGLIFSGVGATPFLTSDSAIALDPACAKGQIYWCQNLAVAKSCGAVTHCIQSVWEKQTYPVDNDSICQICLDMVKQARDQLRSNETMEELKEVFEGTCEFIRIKSIRKECDKLADDMVPELVEALSSQMNPQVVCTVSGLCNNAKIDKELRKHANEVVVKKHTKPGLTCNQCNTVSTLISTKFANTNRDRVLENLLEVCGQMSSLSDGCSAIVLAYFNEVYDHLKTNLNSDNICHMAGVCADQFHQHEEDHIEITPDSQIGYVQREGDDIPCDLCKQLIVHLRDLLVANTTQAEFKTVLEGICKQTKSFKSECLSLADQYYDVIYAKLTQDLDPDGACFMIGICPKDLAAQHDQQSYEVAPLVPSSQLLVKKKLLGENEPVFSAQEIQSFQLPKDVLLLNADQLAANAGQRQRDQPFCTVCEYFLHFVQDALASPVNEANIKNSVLNMCHKAPKALQDECQQFVDTYGDAVIALLIQEIDPSEVCPRLSVCVQTTSTANEKCPLCLFLVQDLEEQLQHNKSKKNIEDKLQLLCQHLRDDLKAECIDFINTYTAELVDKLANDFTPREICLYLKCCTDKEETLIEHIGDKASYNDYLTNTVYQIETEETSSPECILCEQLVKDVEKKISKDKSKEHIKEVLEQACSTLPKAKLKNKCKAAVEKNADFIVDLLIKEVTPKEVCLALGFCFTQHNNNQDIVQVVNLPVEKPTPNEYVCRLCQVVVKKVEDELNNKTAQEDVEKCLQEVCVTLPNSLRPKCKKFIDAYANEIIKHIPNDSPKDVCTKACVCNAADEEYSAEPELIDDISDSPECALCEQIIKEVESKVVNDKSEEHIKEVLKHACSSIKKEDLKAKCIEDVEKNIDFIVNAIVKNASPKQICHGIGYCASHNVADIKIEQVADQLMQLHSDTPQCVLCELIATKLEADLKDKKHQDEIENAIRRVCHSMPSKFSTKCNKFIEDYGDLFISIVSTVPPKQLCGELNFCRSKANGDTSRQDVLECAVCNTAVDALAIVLEKNGPKEHPIVVETTCHLLPSKYYQQCHDFLDIYGISVTTLIKRSEKRSDICVQVGKCFRDGDNSMFVEISDGINDKSDESNESSESNESAESHRPLLGANHKCTYGPSYWCSNAETMIECNAEHFCNVGSQKLAQNL